MALIFLFFGSGSVNSTRLHIVHGCMNSSFPVAAAVVGEKHAHKRHGGLLTENISPLQSEQ